MKQLQSYTYTIPANGSVQIPAPNDNFIITAATGPVTVRGDTFGKMASLTAGQGLKSVPFNRLELFDESGAPNTVTILLSPVEFLNQVFSGSVSITAMAAAVADAIRRPEEPNGQWINTATVVANTPLTVFTAAANVNGAILWNAGAQDVLAGAINQTFLAKATAPANVSDGQVCAIPNLLSAGGANYLNLSLPQPVRIAAGLGLYFISSAGGTAGMLRFARYTLL